jgi:hypothetical protein
MRNDQIFVLLLVVLLPMSGCFDAGSVGEAEGAQDSTDALGTTIVNNYYNNTTSNSQERIWYSSGDVVNSYWNDGQDVSSGGQRCLEYGPSYDSNTGEYLGEECKVLGYPSALSDWNGTNCDGVLVGQSYAPTCAVTAKSITTNSGEALILYQLSSISVSTTCNGVLASSISSIGSTHAGDEYVIVSGSSMPCVHDIVYTQSYQESSDDRLNDQKIWSLVYAIQETVVV